MVLFLKVLSVLFWSAIKFFVGLGLAIGFGFNPLQALILSVGGGMLGVVFYLYLWALVLNIYHRYYPKKHKVVKFSKFKRKLVRFIKKYEVWGIALLTPVLLTPPVGTVLAASIEHNKWRIKLIMFISFTAWALVVLGFRYLFQMDFDKLF